MLSVRLSVFKRSRINWTLTAYHHAHSMKQSWRNLLLRLMVLALVAGPPTMAVAADTLPWNNPNNALVIDAYELNTIDWDSLLSDKRIAAFISKASDGLPESFS